MCAEATVAVNRRADRGDARGPTGVCVRVCAVWQIVTRVFAEEAEANIFFRVQVCTV